MSDTLDRLRRMLAAAETERDEAIARMAATADGAYDHAFAMADRDDAQRTIDGLSARIAEEETDALRPVSNARLRELADVAPGPHGGVLIDAAFLRALAREMLSARESTAPFDPAIHCHRADVVRDLRDYGEAMVRGNGPTPPSGPPTRAEVIAHEKHGGFWFVSRVENAMPGSASDIRPMVLRVLTRDDRFVATIPGNDFGGYWNDPDPWRLMPGATWTPLDRHGVPMARDASPPLTR